MSLLRIATTSRWVRPGGRADAQAAAGGELSTQIRAAGGAAATAAAAASLNVPKPLAGAAAASAGASANLRVGQFPLSVHSSQRYLIDANGDPFFIHGDTIWMAINEFALTHMVTYLNDRQSKGFNAVIVEAPGAFFTSQNPRYLDRDGNQPFNPTSYTSAAWSSPVEAFWARLDYFVQQARQRGIAVFLWPAYSGFGGGSGSSGDQGWDYQIKQASDAALRDYGQFIGTRYGNSNVVIVTGGDYNDPAPAKQNQIMLGIADVAPNMLISGHTARDNEAFAIWGGQPWFNLNNIYVPTTGVSHTLAASAYARSLPFFLVEGAYDEATNAAQCRLQAYQSLLGGACGHFFGHGILWGCGADVVNGGPGQGADTVLANYLATTITTQIGHVKTLFTSKPWQLLQPRTDGSLVTSALGTGAARVCPALASDGSFAFIWKPASGNVTVNMAAINAASIRARFFDPVNGTYATVTGSPFPPSSQIINWPGERVLVLEPA